VSGIISNNERNGRVQPVKIVRKSHYFGSHEPLYGCFHTVSGEVQNNGVAVICPPLAIEYMNSHRSMRYLADYFALAGISVLRFDYSGTGDSSDLNENGERLSKWLKSITLAIDHAKTLSGSNNVSLIGFRMGATLAALASEKLDIDTLVLWAPYIKGKAFVREIKALQRVSSIENKSSESSFVEAAGMVYWEETVSALTAIDLLALETSANKTLVVSMDKRKSSTKLLDAWSEKNCFIEQFEWEGAADMLLLPSDAIIPHESIKKIASWVKQNSNISHCANTLNDNQYKVSELFSHDVGLFKLEPEFVSQVRETLVSYGNGNSKFAIYSEPIHAPSSPKPVLVFSNSGVNHRVGPSRLYVLLARELASIGFRVLRIDFPGIGESIVEDKSNENIEYVEGTSEEIVSAIRKSIPDYASQEYILAGLCSGAYASFLGAIEITQLKIIECVMINPLVFYWEHGVEMQRGDTRSFRDWNWYQTAVRRPESWRKLVTGNIDFTVLFGAIKDRGRIVFHKKTKKAPDGISLREVDIITPDLEESLIKISTKNVFMTFILADSDPGFDILMTSAGSVVKKLEKNGLLDIFIIKDADHSFSRHQPRVDAIVKIIGHLSKRYND